MRCRYFLALLLLILTSCGKNEINEDFEDVMCIFHPRKCDYLWAFNISKKDTTLYGYKYTESTYVSSEQSVNINDYALEFTTCNVDMDAIEFNDGKSYKEVYESGYEEVLFKIPAYEALWNKGNHLQDASDKIIESKLSAFLVNKNTKANSTSYPYADLCHIDYRTTPIKDIKIVASADINEIKAGESLNSLFVVDGYPKNHRFIITSTKELITDNDKITNISIDKYLYYRPMAPAALTFKFRDDVDVKAPTKITFTIELATLDGKLIKSETPLVTLTPRKK